jgi:hypothetical protein
MVYEAVTFFSSSSIYRRGGNKVCTGLNIRNTNPFNQGLIWLYSWLPDGTREAQKSESNLSSRSRSELAKTSSSQWAITLTLILLAQHFASTGIEKAEETLNHRISNNVE